MNVNTKRDRLAEEAKAIVALAFRNGPIEDVHAGKRCPTCDGRTEFSRITDPEMKAIMKSAVDTVYHLLRQKADDPNRYDRSIHFGSLYTAAWDDPAPVPSRHSGDGRMREINRSAVTVIPKQPFLEWLHTIDPTSGEMTLSDLANELDIYLIPECESDADFDRCLRVVFPDIFEHVLDGWWTDKTAWPKHRSFDMFKCWFEVSFHSLVLDLSQLKSTRRPN